MGLYERGRWRSSRCKRTGRNALIVQKWAIVLTCISLMMRSSLDSRRNLPGKECVCVRSARGTSEQSREEQRREKQTRRDDCSQVQLFTSHLWPLVQHIAAQAHRVGRLLPPPPPPPPPTKPTANNASVVDQTVDIVAKLAAHVLCHRINAVAVRDVAHGVLDVGASLDANLLGSALQSLDVEVPEADLGANTTKAQRKLAPDATSTTSDQDKLALEALEPHGPVNLLHKQLVKRSRNDEAEQHSAASWSENLAHEGEEGRE